MVKYVYIFRKRVCIYVKQRTKVKRMLKDRKLIKRKSISLEKKFIVAEIRGGITSSILGRKCPGQVNHPTMPGRWHGPYHTGEVVWNPLACWE